jgi:hypothetical protein
MSNDTQSPGPNPPNHTQVEVHPGWVRSGRDDTPGRKAYYINLEAKPGMGDKVELDEMLAYPAHLYRLDVMFGKFSVMFGKKITSE